ncbi:riboflavin transporter PnuX [Cutibacterium acnes JCM 18909]|nr:riboflavin transporter PnuX [Cutibacterium acnes JCM 18909]
MSDVLASLLNAQLDVGLGKPILWREVIGNLFGLASALGGARRRLWAWPVGIIGNVILFTVFLGGVFHTPQDLNLWGQAGRQIFFFLATSAYGWVVWAATRHNNGASQVAVHPRWATRRERMWALTATVIMLVVFTFALKALGPGVRCRIRGFLLDRSLRPGGWRAAGMSSGLCGLRSMSLASRYWPRPSTTRALSCTFSMELSAYTDL